jgi:hypothetical protein
VRRYIQVANEVEDREITLDQLVEQLLKARETVGGAAIAVIDFDASHLRSFVGFEVRVDPKALSVDELLAMRGDREATDELIRRARAYKEDS